MTLSAQALEDIMSVPRFHRDFFKKHWGKNTGIFIKTPLPLGVVWAHFRKFTQYHDENEKAFFFRFWESSIFIEYWKYFSFSYERVRRFFIDNQGSNHFEIHFCIDNKVTTFTPNLNKIKQESVLASPFTLDDEDHRILQEIVDKGTF